MDSEDSGGHFRKFQQVNIYDLEFKLIFLKHIV